MPATTRTTRQTRPVVNDTADSDEPSPIDTPLSEADAMEADDPSEADATRATADATWPLYDVLLAETSRVADMAARWCSTYEERPADALTELVNLLIRASRCTGSIAVQQIDEHDSIPSILENLQAAFDSLIISDAGESQLWDGHMVNGLTAWIMCMSSSQFRPFRHTATVVAFALASALCFIGQRATTTLRTLRQQLETEQRKHRPNAQRVASIREQTELLADRQASCDEMLDGLFDGIFVHRYRDIDPAIRVDCVSFLGEWIIRYPDRFMDSQYMRYLGWSMADNMVQPRIAALRALIKLHRDRALVTTLTPLTDRYKAQLLQLATKEKDVNVRVAAIQLAAMFGKQGAWESDEERDALCQLIAHPQPKIQKAVAPLCAQIIKEEFVEPALNEARHGSARQAAAADVNESWIAWKAFAAFCLQYFSDAILSDAASTSTAMTSLVDGVVAALWHDIAVLKEWRSLVDLLAMDHSATMTATTKQSRRRRSTADQPAHHMLSEQEEAILLGILSATIRLLVTQTDKAVMRRSTKQEAPVEEVHKDISVYLMPMLPGLFAKYGPDADRVASLLAVVRLLDFTNYLTLNQPAALAELLEHVARAFLHFDHTMTRVMSAAAMTLRTMRICAPVAQQTSMKLLEIRDAVLEPLWTVCADKILASAELSTRELSMLSTAATRIEVLLRHLDVADILHESRNGTTIGQLLGQLLGRLSLDRAEEVELSETVLDLHYRAILWMIREQQEMVPETFGKSGAGEGNRYVALAACALDHCAKVIRDGSSGVDRLKQRAFNVGCQLYWMIHVNKESTTDNEHTQETSVVPCSSDTQRIYAKYMEQLIEQHGDTQSSIDINACMHACVDADTQAEHTLLVMLGSFARCLVGGVFDLSHAVAILASYGRFSNAFNEITRSIVEQTGLARHSRHDPGMSTHVISASLKESFDHVTFKRLPSLDATMALARLLVENGPRASCVDLHCDGITFVVSKMAGYARVGNTRIKMDMLRYFKVLAIFTKYMQPAEADQILAFLDSTCSEHGIRPNERAKAWDPYTAYVKLLAAIKERAVVDENRILDSPLLASNNRQQDGAEQAIAAELDELAGDLRRMPVDDGHGASFMSTDTPPRRHAVRHHDISQQLNADASNVDQLLDDTPTLRGKKRDFTASLMDMSDNDDGGGDNDDRSGSPEEDEQMASDIVPETASPLAARPKRLRGRGH
ncbi:hypothetical protein SYNPS1DRAFT_27815 [Syncephalis pseudoplumigaleata]|uniref:SCD domain-containing protein n=1 Tax=Syncephalis pseudoplumigaleata TaxID=1712513 RepID=A0A4P9Z289_9FUNG|nr:hypothetical protein SYNPS1DRAFT_27815 [Syncephalis pseudoplumigaleata]|eukprot:RKP26496.1 hypothetical protein SYNPS1DRAFT_27815 [Syncephalis pseudoplumigaleata]